jgi:hypothetical protein
MQNYNTGKEPILVREFGRNFQKMILFAKDIPNREARQAAIDRIVDLILEMYPVNYRNVEDYKIKIWSHILLICDYQLDVEIPENIPAKKEKVKPERVPYPNTDIRFKHYGKGIERLIEKATTIEDPEKKEDLIRVIGAFMKMCYKNWNRENASDDVVAQEMRILSKGIINLGESTNINYLIQPQTKVSGVNSITNQQNQKKPNSGKPHHHRQGGQGPYNKSNSGQQGQNQGQNKNKFKKFNPNNGQGNQNQGNNPNFKNKNRM